MRKIFIVLGLALLTSGVFAQDFTTKAGNKIDFGFDLFYDIWGNKPEGMQIHGLSFGNSIYAMYEKEIWTKDGRFRLGMGVGVTTHKLSTNTTIKDPYETPITFVPIHEDIEFDKSKFVVNYLDFPIEIRYKTPSKFRLAIGAKLGFRLNNHTTYKGEELTNSGIYQVVKYKKIKDIEGIRFGTSLKFGYKWLNFNVFYSLTKLFSGDKGPELYPISIGITFNPF
ncbi:MAG: PorT family protein [Clostridia bacterium]|nr:PorT family protein [Clostridia bacterium]